MPIFHSTSATETESAKFLIDDKEVTKEEFISRYEAVFKRKLKFDESWFIPSEIPKF